MAITIQPWNAKIFGRGYSPDQPAFNHPGFGQLYSEKHALIANAILDIQGTGGGGTPTAQAIMATVLKSGDLDVAAVDLENQSVPTNIAPIIVPFNASIVEFNLFSTANTADYDIQILQSINGGVSYTTLFTQPVSIGSTTVNPTVNITGLSDGDLLRIRYVRVTGAGTFVSNPQVTLVLEEV